MSLCYSLAIAFLLTVTGCSGYTICTVGPLGSDFTDIQDGLDGCNGGSGDIQLVVNTSVSYFGPFVFPTALRDVRIEPDNPGRISVLGAGHFVDPLYSWLSLTLVNFTFDGLGTPLALFEPRLTNTNFTCERCFYRGFNGTHVFRQESCVETTRIVFRDNVFSDVPANAIEIYAAETIIFERSTCPRCSGDPNVTFGSVFFFHIHQISRGQFIMSFNAQWRTFDNQPLRCRWFLDADANVRCNQVDSFEGNPIMELQCFDRIATADAGFCFQGSQTVPNPLGGNVTTVEVVNDYLPLCRVYRKCTCNSVEFSITYNGTETTTERPLGDVFYGDNQDPDGTFLPCIPSGAVAPNGTLSCSKVFNQYSEQDIDETKCANAWTSGVFAEQGEIANPCVCPPEEERFAAAQDVRVEEEFPCRYSFQDGVLCNEGTPLCCAEPHWANEDSRYYIRGCADPSPAQNAVFVFYVNFTWLRVGIDPNFNSSHFSVFASLTNTNGVFGPFNAIYPHGVISSFVLGGEVIMVSADVAASSPLYDVAFVSAVLESQPVSGSATMILDDIIDVWTYTLSGYGVSESIVSNGNSIENCVDFEEVVAVIFGSIVDPIGAYDGEIRIDMISSIVLDELRLVFEDDWNSTVFTRVQLFVDGAVAAESEVFITPPGVGVLSYNGGTELITVTLAGDGTPASPFTVNLEVSLLGESDPLFHHWEYDADFQLGNQLVATNTFGLWEALVSQTPPLFGDTLYFMRVERVSVFFDRLLQSNCSTGVDNEDCLFWSDCATVGCDQTVDGCTVYSCYALFTETAQATVNITNSTNTTGITFAVGEPFENGTIVAIEYDDRVVTNETVVNGTVVANATVINNGTVTAVTWEWRVFPLAEGALVLPSLGVLQLCDVVDPLVLFNRSGPYDYDSGWLFRPDGAWYAPLMDPVSREVWEDPGTWPAPGGLPIAYYTEPVNRVASECCTGLYRECSCVGVDPAGGTQSASHPYWPDSNYTCRASLDNATVTPWCDCSSEIFDLIYPPQNDTIVYYIAHLPPTLSFVQMVENRAQQLTYGAYFQDTPYELVNDFSFAQPKRWDKLGLLREFYDNDNEFVTGARHDLIQNPPPLPPRFPGDTLELDTHMWCDNGCPLTFITEEEFTCIVDKEATPDVTGWDVTTFETISDAIARAEKDGGCIGAPGSGKNRTILARYTEQYFDETMDITKNSRNLLIASLDSARIVGSAHEVDGRIDELTLLGLQLVHARENKKPVLLTRGRDLERMTVENCDFFGEQVRSGGLTNGRRINYFTSRACSYQDWEQYALRLDDTSQGVVFENNQVINSVGRTIFIKVDLYAQLQNNDFIDVRGGANYKEAAFVSIRARSRQACQEWDPDVEDENVPLDEPNVCKLIGNHQIVSVYEEDERDQCFWLDRGWWNAHRIRNNRCIKAQYGFTGSKLDGWSADGINGFSDIRGGTLEWMSVYNPLLQSSIFRSETRRKLLGWDYRLRSPRPRSGLGGLDVLNFFVSGSNAERNFGDLGTNRMPQDFINRFRWELNQLWFGNGANGSRIRCEVNNNFDDEFMPFRAPFPEFPLVYFVHGFHNFHNVSLGAVYCTDDRVLIGGAPNVFITSYNGSRIRQDNITLARDTWLIGDTSNNDTWCRIEDGWLPVVAGHDHRASAPNINMTLLAYWLDFYEDLQQTEIWRTFSIPQRWMILDRVEFDGRNKIPRSQARIFDFDCGEVVDLPLNSAGEIKTNKPIPPSRCLFEFYDITVKDFIDFEGRVVDQVTGEREIVDGFPYTDGGRIRCLNAFNADTNVVIQNSKFLNLDREALYIENCLRTYLMDNQFLNVSGRSRDNRQAVFVEGNPNNNTAGYQLLYFHNNTATQEKPVLFRSTAQPMNPAFVTSYWFHGFPSETLFCFQNNYASGLYVGARFTALQRSILTSCLPEDTTIPFFPDRKRELRSLCVYNNNSNVKGIEHDLVWDKEPGTQDRWRNNDWCDDCCPLEDPDICYVDAIPEMCVPENPWYDRFFFCSINRAIERCISVKPFVYVIGRQNIFGWFPDDLRGPIGNEATDYQIDYPVPFKTYCEQIYARPQPRVFIFNLLNETGNFTYNRTIVDTSRMVVAGAWGHQVCARGHAADLSRDVTLTIEGLNFTHCDETCTRGSTGGGLATWMQPALYNSSGLHLNDNLWNGADSDARPHDGIFDSQFKFRDNDIGNYTGDFGSRFIGRDCSPETLIRIIGNRWSDFPGEASYVAGAGSIVYDFNRHRRSGGQVAAVDWVTYLSQCDDAQPGVISVRRNRYYEIDQTQFSSIYKVALWLGDVYLQTKTWVLKQNCIDETIDVAVRFENMPGSDRGLLSAFMLDPNDHMCADGIEHDFVEGPPSNDAAIDADPEAERQHWCDDGCAPPEWLPLAILLGILFMLALCALLIIVYCCCPSLWNRTARTTYSRFLGREIPLNRHKWPRASDYEWHKPDPDFSSAQVLPRTEDVAPGVQVSQQASDSNSGGWWLPQQQMGATRDGGGAWPEFSVDSSSSVAETARPESPPPPYRAESPPPSYRAAARAASPPSLFATSENSAGQGRRHRRRPLPGHGLD